MVLAVLVILSLNQDTNATAITIPYTFVAGTTIIASQVNANFSVIAGVVNGNLDNSNIKSGANIDLSKLNLTETFLDLQAVGTSLGVGVGQSGDTQPRVGMYGNGGLQFGIGGSTAPDVQFIHSATNTVQMNNAAGSPGPTIFDMFNGAIINLASYTAPFVQGLRISISATLAIPADGTNTTIYAVPYTYGYIALYNALNAWQIDAVPTNLSVAVPATTTTNYDVYVYDSSGTPTLGVAVWTNATTPPTRGFQNGVAYTNGSIYDRWIGCIATNGTSGTTEDDTSERLVWNYNNQVGRALLGSITTSEQVTLILLTGKDVWAFW